jgi:hypothetical protein
MLVRMVIEITKRECNPDRRLDRLQETLGSIDRLEGGLFGNKRKGDRRKLPDEPASLQGGKAGRQADRQGKDTAKTDKA